LTPFELPFGRQPSVSHLRLFGCKFFILKLGNLERFESCSSDVIFLGYTPHGRSYRVLNLETNTVIESCDVSFNEAAPCTHHVFESVDDNKMEESIFVDEELRASRVTKMKILLLHQLHHLGLCPTSTPEAEVPQAATSSSEGLHGSGIEREINSKIGAPSHIQKAHPPQ
jgi:hypothetical protein